MPLYLKATSPLTGATGGSTRNWWSMPTRTIYTPVGAGSNVNVTNATELDTALTTATPGDCINLASGEYGQFFWQANPAQGHQSGTAGAPITVQAQAGATVTFTGSGVSNGADCLRLEDVDYWRVSGIHVKTAQFPVRLFSCTNGEWLNNKVSNSGDSLMALQYWSRVTGSLIAGDPCSNILIEGCEFYDSGNVNSQYGEGLYLGNGSTPWVDTPHDIEIRYCDFTDLTADGVDIKSGSYNIDLHHCDFHDWTHDATASVISHGPMDVIDPSYNTLDRDIKIHHNRMWNIGLPSAYTIGISCHLGGEKIYNNLMWAFGNNASTRGINIRGVDYSSPFDGYQGSTVGTLDIYNNTIWVDSSINKYYQGTPPTINIWNNITQDGAAGSTETITSGAEQVAASVFLGPVPTVNTSGTAIGTGETEEGSAFIPASATSVPQTTGTTPSDDLSNLARPQGARAEKGALEYLA